MIENSQYENVPKEKVSEFVLRAIGMLMEGQVSETIILSSHKINSILQEKLGKSLKVDRIGRALARIARKNELKKMSTRVPKYILKKSQFNKLSVPE
ncbi:hypothetical protein NEF87_001377 [Candidatus Lokiarchaeum ossiferum]|uniref:Uncharacterized protein n=1 Tax=Candidatus Lokiarchaeum ossiferum TaxID=2951803 RepID=A0ABY6HNL7_9ARCH|nr:hypothetical protein NEF87_001377 [Candidatus Lokiarchaeum sp. B-35]